MMQKQVVRGWKIWIAVFMYTAFIGAIVQVVALPRLFPALHAGQGLLAGLDSVHFHQLAVDRAREIHLKGWSAWELRPEGQAPAGIAGAVYALTVPEPWTIIPINAALHATAALILLLIIEIFVPNRRLALLATLPFVLYPSAMIWYTQLLKDGYSIVGTLLFAYGWMRLARLDKDAHVIGQSSRSMVWVTLGALLVWIVRPYSVQMMQGLGIVMALLLTAVWLCRAASGSLPWRKILQTSIVAWVMVAGLSPLTSGGIWMEAVASPAQLPVTQAAWRRSSWLPRFVDNKFSVIAVIRDEFRLGYPEAGSNVDTNVRFRSAREVLTYLPRAAEIAFFAPFPAHWFVQGTTPGGTIMRRITAIELVGLYAALVLLPYATWRWRDRLELYVILVYCISMMLIYCTTITNVGAIHRMRYGFIMTLAGLSVAGGLTALDEFSARRNGVYQARETRVSM